QLPRPTYLDRLLVAGIRLQLAAHASPFRLAKAPLRTFGVFRRSDRLAPSLARGCPEPLLYVILDDGLELLRDPGATECHSLLSVDEHRRGGLLPGAGE